MQAINSNSRFAVFYITILFKNHSLKHYEKFQNEFVSDTFPGGGTKIYLQMTVFLHIMK